MPNNMTVIGFGQCGSSVAFEISTKFDPLAITRGESIFEAMFKFNRTKWGSDKADLYSKVAEGKPRLFVGDLNIDNPVYVYTAKLACISKNIVDLDSDDAAALSKIQKAFPDLPFNASDIHLIKEVRRNPDIAQFIVPIYFSQDGTSILNIGGAGGQQFISEAVASAPPIRDSILSKMGEGDVKMIFGVFALGGGTGAGSLFSLLTEYKRREGKYTVGIGILPGQADGNARRNVGRYAIRFLSRSPEDRYHTLAVVSNSAAEKAILNTRLKDGVVPATPLFLVNQYVASFIWFFSLMRECDPTYGKAFDPMDGRIHFSGITTLGVAFGTGFDPTSLIQRALSPMHIHEDRLQGISIDVTRDAEQHTRVADLLRLLFRPDNTSKEERKEKVSELTRLAPFYQSQKTVYVFYFIGDKAFSDRASDAQLRINELYRDIIGNNATITVNCLYNHKLHESAALVMSFGALPREILDGVMRYIAEAFLVGKEAAFDIFRKNVIELLGQARAKLVTDEVRALEKHMGEFFKEVTLPEEEVLTSEAEDVVSNLHSIRAVIGEAGVSQFLVKRNEVKACFDSLIASIAIKPDFETGVDEVL